MLSFQLQKSPTPNFEGKCGNSPDISKGISQSGMCKFESSEVSQAVTQHESDKCSRIGAFCELSKCLYTPNLNNLRAKLPIVSGLHLKYSRFWETRARDRARSALRAAGVSRVAPCLCPSQADTDPRLPHGSSRANIALSRRN